MYYNLLFQQKQVSEFHKSIFFPFDVIRSKLDYWSTDLCLTVYSYIFKLNFIFSYKLAVCVLGKSICFDFFLVNGKIYRKCFLLRSARSRKPGKMAPSTPGYWDPHWQLADRVYEVFAAHHLQAKLCERLGNHHTACSCTSQGPALWARLCLPHREYLLCNQSWYVWLLEFQTYICD